MALSIKTLEHHASRIAGSEAAWRVDFWLSGELLWSHQGDLVPALGSRWHGFVVVASEVTGYDHADVTLEWSDNAPLITM